MTNKESKNNLNSPSNDSIVGISLGNQINNNKTSNQNSKENSEIQIDRGSYEIIKSRLHSQASNLKTKLERLNSIRKTVFGTIEFKLLDSKRITTNNNCIPRDIVSIGEYFIFGYNVFFGLKTETKIEDVFAVYKRENNSFIEQSLDFIYNPTFETEFRDLYKYYKNTVFQNFVIQNNFLYAIFKTGRNTDDIKAFKWEIRNNKLEYRDSRSAHDVKLPPQHEFEWKKTTREMHRLGQHPHISIEDRVFIETVGGDLTIKIEDNTSTGEGIYSEPVLNPDQTLDDAEIYYAIIENLILFKVKPYQEKDYRYIVYNDKLKKATRIDSIEDACLILPSGHGIIFPNGYYLQTGDYKKFESIPQKLKFVRKINAVNGEDTLYVFHSAEEGVYVLLSYNVIEQKIESPIVCGGWSLFYDGTLIYFQAVKESQKYHTIQIWQTPYVSADFIPHQADQTSFLHKIGNKDVVKAMAEIKQVIMLLEKDDSFEGLYIDIIKNISNLLDSFFWLSEPEVGNIKETLLEIKDTATTALAEYEKVSKQKKHAKELVKNLTNNINSLITQSQTNYYDSIDAYVKTLADFRKARSEIISAKDIKFIDLSALEKLEKDLEQNFIIISSKCSDFLQTDTAFKPYIDKLKTISQSIETLKTAHEAKDLDNKLIEISKELEMLIDIISNLKIDDATKRTHIIEAITSIFSELNQIRSQITNKTKELQSIENKAEFSSQFKLLHQSFISAIDLCDTPEKCDEQLSKIMLQLEELEGKFADNDEFSSSLSEKRQEIYSAFESKKLALTEARNKKCSNLAVAAERILKGIENRLKSFQSQTQVNEYFSTDIMIEKVRDITKQLYELKDSVRADEITTKLKTIYEDAIRQIKDKQDIYENDEKIIKLGSYKFSVNKLSLDITFVSKDDDIFVHLTGTNFYEKITDPEIISYKDLWEQELVSENSYIYRGEYLAYCIYSDLIKNSDKSIISEMLKKDKTSLFSLVQSSMAHKYNEGYIKGVHDHDATNILIALLEMHNNFGPMRYNPTARALAMFYWKYKTKIYKYQNIKSTSEVALSNNILSTHESREIDNSNFAIKLLETKLSTAGMIQKYFANASIPKEFHEELLYDIESFISSNPIFSKKYIPDSVEYLCTVFSTSHSFLFSREATELFIAFRKHLDKISAIDSLSQAFSKLKHDPLAIFALARAWLEAYINDHSKPELKYYLDEAALLLLEESLDKAKIFPHSAKRTIDNMVGSHNLIKNKCYDFHFNMFLDKLTNYCQNIVPKFLALQNKKREIIQAKKEELRLDEYKAKVLTSFVRNRLIDEVYLPLIGANLAKQIGEAGEKTRTDRMGLLLLISPPGYGKTTLMEYIANRLGLVFIKINGPAIGNKVHSLDPLEATSITARQELEKLNMALSMGDNVMIYIDDIQHCSPEFLEKFISLCDAQRKIEGVYNGKPKTFDLRGKKVAIVMAGNPYTESGERFKIPDMLANRADTYNLGDIIGNHVEAFIQSYLENAATSNPTLSKLFQKSYKDFLTIIKIAENKHLENINFEINWSSDEVSEFISVMKKLIKVRDVILKVNREYIKSASQSDAYRTEPPFKLQGSYRNMNKIAEKVVPIMNDEELDSLIESHYINEAQTLTSGAEFNLLKFREIIGKLTNDEKNRLEEIRKTFQRHQMFYGIDTSDRLGQLMAQINTLSVGVLSIKEVLAEGLGINSNQQSQQSSTTLSSTSNTTSIASSSTPLKFNS